MEKSQLFFLLIFTIILTRVNCNQQQFPAIRLRSFAIYSLKILSDLAKNYEQQEKLRNEIEEREMNMKNEQIVKDIMKRREILEKYLGSLYIRKNF